MFERIFDDYATLWEANLATLVISNLIIVLGIAFVAFWWKSRLTFFTGCLGSLAGWVIPFQNYDGSLYFACVGHFLFFDIHSWVEHILFWGILGALVGGLGGLAVVVAEEEKEREEQLETAQKRIEELEAELNHLREQQQCLSHESE